MTQFAKIFNSKEYGQLVLIIQAADGSGEPELLIFMAPPDLGVSSMTLKFDDTETGWDECEANFKKADMAWAERVVKPMFENLGQFSHACNT